ncbi:MAG: carboxypeptidase regulatory-like domain-containing protein, partial [Bacteroidales bacterium]|nr:carboxypeptidase regulatory-like domain-containing protein [Bacteroidales bacterium]
GSEMCIRDSTSTSQNPTIPNSTTTNGGVYTVTVTNTSTSCFATATTNVTVNQTPIVDAGADQTIPHGTYTTLTGSASGGSGNYSYQWNPVSYVTNPNSSTTQTTNLQSTTVYTLLVTDNVTGCSATDNVTITVTGEPLSVVLTVSDNEICSGEQVTITAIANGGSGSYTYTWYSNPIGFNPGNTSSGTHTPTLSTTYYVTVNDGYNTSVTSILVVVNPTPEVNFTGLDSIYCKENKNILIVGNYSTQGMFSGPGIITANIFNPFYANSGINVITYTYTDPATGCTGEYSKQVIVKDLPYLTVNIINQPNCGLGNGEVLLNGNGGTPPYSFSTGTNHLTNLNSGIYYVTITDANGCSSVESFTLNNSSSPQIEIISTQNASCPSTCNGTAEVQISGGTLPYTILWNNGANTTVVNNLCVGINTVKVFDANNCFSGAIINTGSEYMDPVIYGRIMYSNSAIYSENAKLLLFSTTQQYSGGYDTMPVNIYAIANDGTFYITGIKADTYIVKITIPTTEYPMLANSYYTGGEPSNQWQDAVPIGISCNDIKEINITMYEFYPIDTGIGYVEGRIFYLGEDGEGTKGIYIKGNRASDEPVEGIEVFIKKQPSGKSVKMSITNNNGLYSFDQLPTGNYSLLVEIPGFPMLSTYNLTIDETNSSYTGLDFVVDTTSYEGYIDTLYVFNQQNGEPQIWFTIYPNPIVDNLYISYYIKDKCSIEIELLSSDSKTITIYKNKDREAGIYHEKVPIKTNLPAGIYFIKLRIGKLVYLRKIIK